jgi:hypothetical protein
MENQTILRVDVVYCCVQVASWEVGIDVLEAATTA